MPAYWTECRNRLRYSVGVVSSPRELNGLDQTPASPADATLILIDYQNSYTRGVMGLKGWQEALEAVADLLARAC